MLQRCHINYLSCLKLHVTDIQYIFSLTITIKLLTRINQIKRCFQWFYWKAYFVRFLIICNSNFQSSKVLTTRINEFRLNTRSLKQINEYSFLIMNTCTEHTNWSIVIISGKAFQISPIQSSSNFSKKLAFVILTKYLVVSFLQKGFPTFYGRRTCDIKARKEITHIDKQPFYIYFKNYFKNLTDKRNRIGLKLLENGSNVVNSLFHNTVIVVAWTAIPI